MRIRYSRVHSLVRRERDDAPASRFGGGFFVGSGIVGMAWWDGPGTGVRLGRGSRFGIGWRFRRDVGTYLGCLAWRWDLRGFFWFVFVWHIERLTLLGVIAMVVPWGWPVEGVSSCVGYFSIKFINFRRRMRCFMQFACRYEEFLANCRITKTGCYQGR
jgi:hypothetical protein